MYTRGHVTCALPHDMFIGIKNKQEACEYTPVNDCIIIYVKDMEIDFLATIEFFFLRSAPTLDKFLDTRLLPYNVRKAHIVYRHLYVDVALFQSFFRWSLLVLKSKLWPNIHHWGRYAQPSRQYFAKTAGLPSI